MKFLYTRSGWINARFVVRIELARHDAHPVIYTDGVEQLETTASPEEIEIFLEEIEQ